MENNIQEINRALVRQLFKTYQRRQNAVETCTGDRGSMIYSLREGRMEGIEEALQIVAHALGEDDLLESLMDAQAVLNA